MLFYVLILWFYHFPHQQLQVLVRSVFTTASCCLLFNPFNIVIDSPTRDLAFLYKEKAINLNELISIIDYYKLDQMEISLLMARALFPTATFDILEDYFALKKDIKLSIVKKHKKTKREVNLLVELHKRLVEKYKIRPIEWLLNYTN